MECPSFFLDFGLRVTMGSKIDYFFLFKWDKIFCAAFEGLLRGDKAQWRSFFVVREFSFPEFLTVQPSSGTVKVESSTFTK